MKNEFDIKVGITQGDMNGIGYEVIIKTLMDKEICDFCTPIIYGSPKALAYHRNALNIEEFSLNRINNPDESNSRKPNIINCLSENIRVEFGKQTPSSGESSFLVLERAIQDLKAGKIQVLVTGPINKQSIQSENFQFPGHTEYLQTQFNASEVLMLMVNKLMRVGVVAGHVPIAKVPSMITFENIMKKLKIMNKSLIEDFGIRKPRIALLGLNPHSGDNGLLGMEEINVIQPVIEKARSTNILAFGPFPADGFFGSGSYSSFDGILAMYHDQGLTPFKALDNESGVNFTAGLPIVRTSPAHGTAFEIAGTGVAKPDSFRQAIFTGIDVYRNRQMLKEISSNPLKDSDVSSYH